MPPDARPRDRNFRMAVVKIASRCNLNCTYCYMYNLGDSTYLAQPAVMNNATIDAVVDRAAAHVTTHNLQSFRFAFHGGEPLLAGPTTIQYFVSRARQVFQDKAHPTFSVQTNGTLLTDEWCRLLRDLQVTVGISLDGPKEVNDLKRIDHSGGGSYDKVRQGWDMAVSYGLQPGLASVVDTCAEPDVVYDHLCKLQPRVMDFLLPEATHDKPPASYLADPHSTPYADWLLHIFYRWVADDSARFRIRLFEQIISSIIGLGSGLDSIGTSENRVIVIETDGSIQPVDVLRACKHSITLTPFNVHTHSLNDVLDLPLISLYYAAGLSLCETCRRCALKEICGGGYLSHRYSADTAFDNPSVYCRDLSKLICGIQRWVFQSIPPEVAERHNIELLMP